MKKVPDAAGPKSTDPTGYLDPNPLKISVPSRANRDPEPANKTGTMLRPASKHIPLDVKLLRLRLVRARAIILTMVLILDGKSQYAAHVWMTAIKKRRFMSIFSLLSTLTNA